MKLKFALMFVVFSMLMGFAMAAPVGLPSNAPAAVVTVVGLVGSPVTKVEQVPAIQQEMIVKMLDVVTQIPVVGPYVMKALGFAMIAWLILTLLSTLILGIQKLCGYLGKSYPWLEKLIVIEKALEKAFPFVALLSSYNVQKKSPQA